MPTDISEKEIYEEAKKRVKAKRDFYRNLVAYIVINAGLIVIWFLSGDAARPNYNPGDWTGNKWFLWPLTIWGAFVLTHFLQVFVFKTSVRREKAALEKEVEKIKKGS